MGVELMECPVTYVQIENAGLVRLMSLVPVSNANLMPVILMIVSAMTGMPMIKPLKLVLLVTHIVFLAKDLVFLIVLNVIQGTIN